MQERERMSDAQLEPFVSRAAIEWCGEKERETFPEDVEYFRYNWRHLPGLRDHVERLALLARPSAHEGGGEVEAVAQAMTAWVTPEADIHGQFYIILDGKRGSAFEDSDTAHEECTRENARRAIDALARHRRQAVAEGEAGENGNRPLPFDREQLGRFVREAWVRWAETQPNPKPSWLAPYDELSEPDKEADRQIGEAVARWTLIGDAAAILARPPAPEDGGERERNHGPTCGCPHCQVDAFRDEAPTDQDWEAAAALLGYSSPADATDYRLTGAQDRQVRKTVQAFARHRRQAVAEGEAMIVAWLRAVGNDGYADAIEAGEYVPAAIRSGACEEELEMREILKGREVIRGGSGACEGEGA